MTGRRRTQHLLQAVAAALLAIVLSSSLLASAAITYPSACSSDCSALGASLLGTSCTLANPSNGTASEVASCVCASLSSASSTQACLTCLKGAVATKLAAATQLLNDLSGACAASNTAVASSLIGNVLAAAWVKTGSAAASSNGGSSSSSSSTQGSGTNATVATVGSAPPASAPKNAAVTAASAQLMWAASAGALVAAVAVLAL